MRQRNYKELEEDMSLSAAEIEDHTIRNRHLYRLLSPFNFFYLLLSSLIIASCIDGIYFHSYKPLPEEGWERRDTICFDLPQADQDFNGTLTIGLRTKAYIGMQDIVLAVEQLNDSAEVCRRDTIRYPLTDTKGDALAKGVNHHQYETEQLPISMKKGQGGFVRIHHLMRNEMVQGFTELGIKIN